MRALFIGISLFLVGCNLNSIPPHTPREYELSTNEAEARKQCDGYFKKFHGEYESHKYYGVTKRYSTLEFYRQPDCAGPCITDTFRWECTFRTNDDERGRLIFTSYLFKE